MRKGCDGEKNGKKTGKKEKETTDDYSGHYVIASSQPLERRPLERRTLVPKDYNLICSELFCAQRIEVQNIFGPKILR